MTPLSSLAWRLDSLSCNRFFSESSTLTSSFRAGSSGLGLIRLRRTYGLPALRPYGRAGQVLLLTCFSPPISLLSTIPLPPSLSLDSPLLRLLPSAGGRATSDNTMAAWIVPCNTCYRVLRQHLPQSVGVLPRVVSCTGLRGHSGQDTQRGEGDPCQRIMTFANCHHRSSNVIMVIVGNLRCTDTIRR